MNKTILIIGASQGLGKATAKLFIKEGWNVIGTMRHPENETELTQFPNVSLLKLDITHPEEIKETKKAAEQIHAIDVLFNNAGVGFAGPFEAASDMQLQNLINTNFLGTMLVTKAMLPYFRERKAGTVITTTSSTAYIPYPFISVYEATKAALESWTAGLSYELDQFNIKVKTMVPGYMQTNFGQNGAFVTHDSYNESFNKYISVLMQETASLSDNPDDIAKVVLDAATDGKSQSHYIAGNHANSEHKWLQEEGIETVIESMRKRFF
jgi:short-subunit dehydrogenase